MGGKLPRIHDLLMGSEYWDAYTLKEDGGGLDEWGRAIARGRDVADPKMSRYLAEGGFRIDYPRGKRFAICLTHDIDKAHVGAGRKLLNLARGRLGGRTFGECLGDFASRERPNCNFDQIMNLEEKHGAKSTFFLLALESGEKDYNYRVESLQSYTSAVLDRGFEIGLHGGWEAYRERAALAREKKRIEKALNRGVVGYRNHYLLFNTRSTWGMLEEEGFEYDSTLGFPDAAGFRNGLCHPFNPYNEETDQARRIVELPIAAMDRTLESYNRLEPGAAWERIKAVIDVTERYGGVATLIWHNVFMWGEWGRLYRKILDYGVERGAWMAGGSEIVKVVRDQI
jgi:peptidoglycan/xylan/chitin deacetylase (PgdA/CDA1 family)